MATRAACQRVSGALIQPDQGRETARGQGEGKEDAGGETRGGAEEGRMMADKHGRQMSWVRLLAM